MTGSVRPWVAIVDEDPDNHAALAEWLRAAGYEPVAHPTAQAVAAVVVRWPSLPPLLQGTSSPPVVLLAPPDVALPSSAAAAIAEVVVAPDQQDVRSLLQWSKQLHSALRQLTAPPPIACQVPWSCRTGPVGRDAPSLVAVGVSTGGPIALRELFRALRGAELPPLALVQHIPKPFLAPLVERLAHEGERPVVVADHGQPLVPGTAYLAPGDRHLRVCHDAGRLETQLDDGPPRRGHRPAVEVLFESCAGLPRPGIAVLLTGMGQDGAAAMLALRTAGWRTIGQDEASCAIYGMPKAARQLGAVECELPLAEVGPWLVRACRRAGRPVGA